MAAAPSTCHSPPLPKPPGFVPSPPNQPCTPPKKPLLLPLTPPPPPRKYYLRRRRRCGCGCGCCCCCLWTLLALLLLLCLLALAGTGLYAWLRPTFPEFHVGRLNVTRLELAAGDGTRLTATVDVFLVSRNKNDMIRFDYDKMTVQVSSADEMMNLGRGSVPKFSQPESSMTVIRVHTEVANEVVDDFLGTAVAKSFKEGKMEVDVKMKCMVGAVVGGHHAGSVPITVTCDHVSIAKLAATEEPRCKIYFGGWLRLN